MGRPARGTCRASAPRGQVLRSPPATAHERRIWKRKRRCSPPSPPGNGVAVSANMKGCIHGHTLSARSCASIVSFRYSASRSVSTPIAIVATPSGLPLRPASTSSTTPRLIVT